MFFAIPGTVDEKRVKDVIDGLNTAAQFDWASFARLIILILVIGIVFLVAIYFYLHIKRKISHKYEASDSHVADLVSDIPNILKIIEKMNEAQQETVYRILGYISQERLGKIIKRYSHGFAHFCKLNEEPDAVQKEFEWLVNDISTEVVESNVFKRYVENCGVLVDILSITSDRDFSVYQLEKLLEKNFLSAVGEAIKESKKVSFVEVAI